MYFHTFQIKYLRAYLHLWICISSADLSPIAISAVAKIDRSAVLDSILILISRFPRLRPGPPWLIASPFCMMIDDDDDGDYHDGSGVCKFDDDVDDPPWSLELQQQR